MVDLKFINLGFVITSLHWTMKLKLHFASLLTASSSMMCSFTSDSSARSTTTFDDITAINIPRTTQYTSTHKKPINANIASSRKTGPLSSPNPEDPPYESVSDIFNRRLRTLRKRMQKIERNEELLAAYQLETLKLSKQKSSSPRPCPLNADQLKAIENKSHLAEMIFELEHLLETVTRWLTSSSIIGSINSSPSNSHQQNSSVRPATNTSSSNVQPIMTGLSGKEVLELWMTLSRLDTLPSGFLPNEDLLSLQSANSIIQSLMGAPDQQKSLEVILSWMCQSTSSDGDDGAEPNLSSADENLFSFGPPYSLVRYCTKKTLTLPISSLPSDKTEKNPTKKEERKTKLKKSQDTNGVASVSISPAQVSIPASSEEVSFVQWNVLSSLDDAIIHSNNSTSKSEVVPKKQPAFILKKLQTPALPTASEEQPRRQRHPKKPLAPKTSTSKIPNNSESH